MSAREAGSDSISGTPGSSQRSHRPPLAIPFLAPNPVFEINPRGVGLRASPCRRVDSDEPNAPGDVSQSLGLRGPVARGMVLRL